MSKEWAFKMGLGKESAERTPNIHPSEKLLTPDTVAGYVSTGDVTFVELEKVTQLDVGLLRSFKRFKKLGKPVIVNVHSTGENDLLTGQRVDHFLSHVISVDGVTSTPLDASEDFSLKYDDDSLRSNTHFVPEGLDYTTRARIRRGESPYRQKKDEVEINSEKYLREEQLPDVVAKYQAEGKRVVIMAGVYDVVHPGHIEFLENAGKQGDVLIMLTNSDYSVGNQPKNTKGDRPIHPLEERIEVLAELDMVTHVSSFDTPNILHILDKLSGITYVKSTKDATSGSAGVQAEMDMILSRNGQNIIIPSIQHDLRPEWMSSTGVIEDTRGTAIDDDRIRLEVADQPLVVQEKVGEIHDAINRWNDKTRALDIWNDKLKSRHSMSIEEAALLEREVIESFGDSIDAISGEFGHERSYINYIVPLILGRKLGLDIRWTSIQYDRREVGNANLNFVKLSDGSIEYFNLERREYYDPLVFEDTYFKPLPSYYNFIAKDGVEPFARRVYQYREGQQEAAFALKILKEEIQHATDPNLSAQYIHEFQNITRGIWGSFMGEPFELDDTPFRSHHAQTPEGLPKIVAHGGTSVTALENGFPENSRASIQAALDQDLDVIEIDIAPTKDNQWVVSHDILLDIATEAEGTTLDKTIDELRQVRLRSRDGEVKDERLMGLEEALKLIGEARRGDPRNSYIKIDIKHTSEEAERNLVNILRQEDIPMSKVIMTSAIGDAAKRVHDLEPNLPFELNAAEPGIFLMANDLMDEEIMPKLYLEFVKFYASRANARTVSLMQIAMNTWGEGVFRTLVDGIKDMGLDTQVWVARSMKDYMKDVAVGPSHVMMDDPVLIDEALNYNRQHRRNRRF